MGSVTGCRCPDDDQVGVRSRVYHAVIFAAYCFGCGRYTYPATFPSVLTSMIRGLQRLQVYERVRRQGCSHWLKYMERAQVGGPDSPIQAAAHCWVCTLEAYSDTLNNKDGSRVDDDPALTAKLQAVLRRRVSPARRREHSLREG